MLDESLESKVSTINDLGLSVGIGLYNFKFNSIGLEIIVEASIFNVIFIFLELTVQVILLIS